VGPEIERRWDSSVSPTVRQVGTEAGHYPDVAPMGHDSRSVVAGNDPTVRVVLNQLRRDRTAWDF
jgi:hypothetical protein